MLGKEEKYYDFFCKKVLIYILMIIVVSAFYYFIYYRKDYNICSFFLDVYQGKVVGLFLFLYAYMGYSGISCYYTVDIIFYRKRLIK